MEQKEKTKLEYITEENLINLSEKNQEQLFRWIGSEKISDILKKFSKEEPFSKSPYYKNGSRWKNQNKTNPGLFLAYSFWKDVICSRDVTGHSWALAKAEQKFIKQLQKYIEEPKRYPVADLIGKIDEVADSDITPYEKALVKTILGDVTPNDQLEEMLTKEREQRHRDEADKKTAERQQKQAEQDKQERDDLKKQNSDLHDKLNRATDNLKQVGEQNKSLKEQVQKQSELNQKQAKRIEELEQEKKAVQDRLDDILNFLSDLPLSIPEEVKTEDVDTAITTIGEDLRSGDLDAVKEKSVCLYILAEKLQREGE